MSKKIRGRVWKFGDNVNTDVIIPAKRLNEADPEKIKSYCMEGSDNEEFKKALAGGEVEGDIFVGGEYFGSGSSREHAPSVIKANGIGAVLAEDFAPIFYKNCINIGLGVLQCAEASRRCQQGDMVEIDLDTGEIRNETRDEVYQAKRLNPRVVEVIKAGGLMPYAKQLMGIE